MEGRREAGREDGREGRREGEGNKRGERETEFIFCLSNLPPFLRGKKTFSSSDMTSLIKDTLGSISVCKSIELRGRVPLIHVVYINAIHDVYPNSPQEAATPDGPYVHVLVKYIQKKNSSIVA